MNLKYNINFITRNSLYEAGNKMATASATATSTDANYKNFNTKTGKLVSNIPLYPVDISNFKMLNSKGCSASESVYNTPNSNVKFFPTETYSYKVMDNGYYSCLDSPKESCQWTIYRDDAWNYYSYVKYGGGFWYATKLEIQILEPEL